MKKHIPDILITILLLIGVSILLYPTVSDWWNSRHASITIATYTAKANELDEEYYNSLLKSAQEYNEKLFAKGGKLVKLKESELEDYKNQLDIDGSGMIGSIVIDKIGVDLPIYHGTNEGTLATSIGHVNASSLPIGGENTHCILAGHRGLPSAKLFTKLDEMEVGDTFVLKTLNETLTYEVDNISVVLPEKVSELTIEEGKDLCTLVTCTPYGVNTHRLLVRGHRVYVKESIEQAETEANSLTEDMTADSSTGFGLTIHLSKNTILIASLVPLVLLVFFSVHYFIKKGGKRR